MARDTVSATHARHQGRACHPASLSRPTTIPARSETVLVTGQAYDSAGNLSSQTDPAGMPTCLEYDAADREITKITNCVSGSSSSSSSSGGEACAASDDANITVRTTYNADGNVATLTAVNSATGDQVTQYIYGTTLADSAIAASTLKRAEIYPDSVDDDDRITFSYNRQGQSVGMRDQNGTVHAYDYDLLGRPTQDRVTTLGSGVDGAVRRIGTTYEVRGMKATMTSYDNATIGSGNVLNQCQFVYNDFGQLTTEYQSHSGTVNVSTTPKVQYTFATGSSNTIRTTGLVYPSGRVLTYAYGGTGSISDRSSRIASIIDDDDTHLCDYSYLGLQTFVEQDDTEPQMKWTLIDLAGSNDPDTGDIYSGFDRFGRVKDNRWYNYNSAADVDRIQYGYDRASSRIWRKNTVAAALGKEFDEIYTYDRVHRLKDMARGTLNGSHTSLTSETFAQCWTLDPTGNWTGFRQDDTGNGAWDLVQQRSANKVNEIDAISVTTGDQWATPAYDKNGNMTTIPRPPQDRLSWANLTTDQWSTLTVDEWSGLPVVPAFTATYDAWNRLVKLVDLPTGRMVQDNLYDARGYRIIKTSYTGGSLTETGHCYYTNGWRCVEARLGTSPDNANAKRQYVWGARYIDDLVFRDRDSDDNDILDERPYACHDGNWNATALIATDGTVQERYEYDPYGDCSVLAPAFSPCGTSNCDWNLTYAGYLFDATTGLYLVRFRLLLSRLGWVTRDPLGLAAGTNLYQYTESMPLILIDPLGADACQIFISGGHTANADDVLKTLQVEANAVKTPKCTVLSFGIISCYSADSTSRIKTETDIPPIDGLTVDDGLISFELGVQRLQLALKLAKEDAPDGCGSVQCEGKKTCDRIVIQISCDKEMRNQVKRFAPNQAQDLCGKVGTATHIYDCTKKSWD
ncbi:MAG: RHS repeat-associated core domain-containing protein [Planctomycetaceae bacterium]|nr:RHS repeat-associated core domain-containing protein [Planctomycetaceae bacterium]